MEKEMDFEAYEKVLTPIDKQKVAEVFEILKRIESGKYTSTSAIENSCSHGSKSPLKQRTLDKWIVKNKPLPIKEDIAISQSPPTKNEKVRVQPIQNPTGKELKIIVERSDYNNYENYLKYTNNDEAETNSANLGNAEIGNAVKKKAKPLKLNVEGKQTGPNDQQSPVRYNLRSSSNTSAEKSQTEWSSIAEQDNTAGLQNLLPPVAKQKAAGSTENTVPKQKKKRRQSSSDGLYSLIADIVREGGLTLDAPADQEELDEKRNVEEKHSTLPKIISEESGIVSEQEIDFCNDLNLPKGRKYLNKTPQMDYSNLSLKSSEKALVTNKPSKAETSGCAKKAKTNRSCNTVKDIAPADSQLKKNTIEQEKNCSFEENKTTTPNKTNPSKLSPRLRKQQSPIAHPIQESTISNSASKRKKNTKISEKFIKLEDQCSQDISPNNICSQQDLVSSSDLISKLSESWSSIEKHVKVESTYAVALSEIDLSNTHTLVTDIENIIFPSELSRDETVAEEAKIPMTFDPKENNEKFLHSDVNELVFTGKVISPSSNPMESPSQEASIEPTYPEQLKNTNEEVEEQNGCGSKNKSTLWEEVGASKKDKVTSDKFAAVENNSAPIESDIGMATSNYDLDEDSPTFASDLQNCYEAYMKMKKVFYENMGVDMDTLLQQALLQKQIWTTPSDGLFLCRQKISPTQEFTPEILIHPSKKRLQQTFHKRKSKRLS